MEAPMSQFGECGLPCSFRDNGELLKKALLQFPRRYQHDFTRPAKVDLRRLLSFAASYKGQYMRHLFPDVNENTLPKAWQHVLVPERYQHLESQDFYFQRGTIHDPSHPNRMCSRRFKKGEPVYRCLSCSEDDTAGLCQACFNAKDHEGHDTLVNICLRENGGVCDCGDQEAWKTPLNCAHLKTEEVSSTDVPDRFKNSMLQTFEIVLDYIVDVMAGSTATLPRDKKQDNETILTDGHRSTLEQSKYFGTDWTSEKFHLMLYNDQNRQYRDAVQRITSTTDKVVDFALMVADEVNANGRAKVMTSTNIQELLEAQTTLEATGLPSCIRNARDIFREEMCAEMVDWLTEMMNGEIYGSYSVARDLLTKAFCEKWDSGVKPYTKDTIPSPGGLYNNLIPTISCRSMSTDAPPEHWNINRDNWNMDPAIAEACGYRLDFAAVGGKQHSFHGSRFQYLLFFDIRFWKSIRSNFHCLFNSVLTCNKTFRPVVCAQYVDIYPTLLELFFLFDREPESSGMTSLTSQIFASSSNATMITEHGDLTRFLAAAYGYLTKMLICTPENISFTTDLLLTSFKNRRIGQVFYDICCVLSKTKSFESILVRPFIEQVCDILLLFQGKPTLKREAVEHVEYESNDYGLYFNMYSVIASLSEMISKTLLKIESPSSVSYLISVIFIRISAAESQRLSESSQDITDVAPLQKAIFETPEGLKEVSDFQVHTGLVSFLHPLHAFATLFVQYCKITDFSQFSLFVTRDPDMQAHLLEYPLRTLVLLAQIRVGYWVRNGFSIRTQSHIYRTSGIRESGFKRDVFMTQLMMSFGDRDFVLTSFIARWGLMSWLKEHRSHDIYDEATLPLMVEEFLLTMIQLLTETKHIYEPENNLVDRIKREIIHCLCFQSMTYSKLCTEIPDYLAHEKKFDIVLKTVADYICPPGSNAAGIYKLKDKYMDSVDPFYIHYTPNKRDEAERLLKERLAKKNKIPVTEAVIEPQLQSLDNTPLKNLFAVTSSKIFVQFIRSTLKIVNQEGVSKVEGLLDLSLHLIHVASMGSDFRYSSEFNELIWSEFTADHNEAFFYESVGSLLYKFLTDEYCSAYHSKIRAIFRVLKLKNVDVEGYLTEQVQKFDASILGDTAVPGIVMESGFEKKKRLAKERRAKIMAKFKKQQNKFVEENNVESDTVDADMDDPPEDLAWKYPEEHCILCQMSVTTEDSFFGVVCNVSQFSGSRTVPFQDKYWTLRAFEYTGSLDKDGSVRPGEMVKDYFARVKEENVIGPAFPAQKYGSLKPSIMATSCGHGMHYSCYQNYISSAKSRQTQITRTVPEDFENSEFVCPLCKSLGNMFVPILWSHNKNRLHDFVKPDKSNWFEELQRLDGFSFIDPDVIAAFTATVVADAVKTMKGPYKKLFEQSDPPKIIHEIWMGLSTKVESVSQPHFRDHINKLLSGSIKSTEISLRGVESSSGLVCHEIPNQNLTTLRILAELKKTAVAWSSCNEKFMDKDKEFLVKVSEECVGKLAFLSSARLFDVFQEIDFFDLLVSCTPYGGISTNSLYRMVFTLHLMQVVATILAQLNENLFDGEVSLLDIELVIPTEDSPQNLMSLARQLRDNHPLFDNVSDELFESVGFQLVLYTMVARALTPFLRQVSIWALAVCAESSDVDLDVTENDDLEINRLCTFLMLPSLDLLLELCASPGTYEGDKFSSFIKYVSTTDNDLSFSSLEYPGLVQLIDLPERLDDIFTKVLYKKQNLASMSNFDPAICLFCGDVVNLQKKAAGQEGGECNHHVENECLNDVGIFLLPKHSSTLLLDKGNGSFHPAPYIDSHGEHDSEVRQSQVLKLSDVKYQQFTRQMWLQHDMKNFITRKLEGTLDIGGWETL